MPDISVYETNMQKSIQNFKEELSSIRAGRANPHMLDKITVEYYGADSPLNQVANITIPEARMLVIQPWDLNMLKPIEKSIQASDLGINPTNDGKVLRLTLPPLTEERRKSLTKDVKKKSEDCKIAVRNIRRDAIDNFKKLHKQNEITEDDLAGCENKIQKLTDKYIAQIDQLTDDKNKEIMTV